MEAGICHEKFPPKKGCEKMEIISSQPLFNGFLFGK
jgi:hypothetical protein